MVIVPDWVLKCDYDPKKNHDSQCECDQVFRVGLHTAILIVSPAIGSIQKEGLRSEVNEERSGDGCKDDHS